VLCKQEVTGSIPVGSTNSVDRIYRLIVREASLG
jgi:hypothetical protein